VTPEIIKTWPVLVLGLTSFNMATIPFSRPRPLKSGRMLALGMTLQVITGAESFSSRATWIMASKRLRVAQLMFPIRISPLKTKDYELHTSVQTVSWRTRNKLDKLKSL
jgi:hypothetical protein